MRQRSCRLRRFGQRHCGRDHRGRGPGDRFDEIEVEAGGDRAGESSERPGHRGGVLRDRHQAEVTITPDESLVAAEAADDGQVEWLDRLAQYLFMVSEATRFNTTPASRTRES